MAKTVSPSMNALRARSHNRRQRRSRQHWLATGLVLIGLALLFGTAIWWSGERTSPAAQDYRAEDVVYGTPLRAVHEMEPTNLASIPFLPKDGPQPAFAVSQAFHDFGRIGATDVVQHQFVIANRGDAPLTISRAYTTCGCTTADFTATVIPPGKVTIMTLTLDAGLHDVRGQTVRRGVIIENNDPNNPQMEIWSQANVGTN